MPVGPFASVISFALLAVAGAACLAAQPAGEAHVQYRPNSSGWSPDAPARSGSPYGIAADYPPQRFNAYFPAGGALSRFADRAGAWYAILYVPVPARWPVELWIWQRSDSHQVRVLALDGWAGPWAELAVPLPLRRESGAQGRPVFSTAPFVLVPDSTAEGVFLLVSQWAPNGVRPPAIWIQVRTAVGRAFDEARAGRPWWSTAPEPAEPVSDPYASPAAGPLAAPRAAPAVVELPIRQLRTPPPRVAIPFEPWWDR